MNTRRWADERGALGGAEVLPFLFLVFVVGILVIFNAWLVVDARLAAASAAREGARAVAESEESRSVSAARASAIEALEAYGRIDAGNVSVEDVEFSHGAFGRCTRATVTVVYDTPFVSIPFLGGVGTRTVTMSHSELVDPYRDGDHQGFCE